MIDVAGEKVILDGPDDMLARELAYLIGTMRSRLASRGHKAGYVDTVMRDVMHSAVVCTLDELRSESKMAAAAWTGRP